MAFAHPSVNSYYVPQAPLLPTQIAPVMQQAPVYTQQGLHGAHNPHIQQALSVKAHPYAQPVVAGSVAAIQQAQKIRKGAITHAKLLGLWRLALQEAGADVKKYGDVIGHTPSSFHFNEKPRVENAKLIYAKLHLEETRSSSTAAAAFPHTSAGNGSAVAIAAAGSAA